MAVFEACPRHRAVQHEQFQNTKLYQRLTNLQNRRHRLRQVINITRIHTRNIDTR